MINKSFIHILPHIFNMYPELVHMLCNEPQGFEILVEDGEMLLVTVPTEVEGYLRKMKFKCTTDEDGKNSFAMTKKEYFDIVMRFE